MGAWEQNKFSLYFLQFCYSSPIMGPIWHDSRGMSSQQDIHRYIYTYLPLQGATTPIQVSPTTTRNTPPAAEHVATRKKCLNSALDITLWRYLSTAHAFSNANTPVKHRYTYYRDNTHIKICTMHIHIPRNNTHTVFTNNLIKINPPHIRASQISEQVLYWPQESKQRSQVLYSSLNFPHVPVGCSNSHVCCVVEHMCFPPLTETAWVWVLLSCSPTIMLVIIYKTCLREDCSLHRQLFICIKDK